MRISDLYDVLHSALTSLPLQRHPQLFYFLFVFLLHHCQLLYIPLLNSLRLLQYGCSHVLLQGIMALIDRPLLGQHTKHGSARELLHFRRLGVKSLLLTRWLAVFSRCCLRSSRKPYITSEVGYGCLHRVHQLLEALDIERDNSHLELLEPCTREISANA